MATEKNVVCEGGLLAFRSCCQRVSLYKKMVVQHFKFEQCKIIFTWYWKSEEVSSL
jgi:hypothetical protein